ncbi:MAG: ATP-binding protein [Bacteroidales bacterium]|nr:ATP-binding protein [Bacteroidales bacterium]
MIKRDLKAVIESRMHLGKAIVVIGARQVGKSTLLKHITSLQQKPVLILNCDEPEIKETLTHANSAELRLLIGGNKIVLVDEAQRVQNIGITLKIIIDTMPDVQLLVTGSSALEIQNGINEPLTGRKFEYHLYPISTAELMATGGLLRVKQTLESRLIYGSYPDILNQQSQDLAKDLLMTIADSYLFKDLLSMESIRRPVLLQKILTALALQVGSEVKYNEIAQLVGSDNKTVEKYIDLLEKCCIVFRLEALSRNVRNELKKGKKIYFWDNGIRNAVIQNFAPVGMRQDMGALWENFFISERMKHNHYKARFAKSYFWRTTAMQEIDYIEELDGRFVAFEMKWNPKKAGSVIPKPFLQHYEVDQKHIITPDNYLDFLL